MENTEEPEIKFNSIAIAKNTLYNLFGYGIPMLFALILIPKLISSLGIEKFGILNIAWMIIGYFSFFDFGIGRSLTKIISEKIGLKKKEEIPVLFWTSLFLMFLVSLIATITLLFFLPSLIHLFKISPVRQSETLITFYELVFAIPIVATTAGLRGVLEAYQKFGLINIIRVILGISTFLIPLLVIIFTNFLYWIVCFLIIIRIFVWSLYMVQCFRINNKLKSEIRISLKKFKPVFRFSIWITIANIVGPVIAYSDRFLIGFIISASAVAYYATPYEIITKLLIIPSSLVAVLFPMFSASYFNNPEVSKKMLKRGLKFIFLILYPVIFLIISFAHEGIKLWLGLKFANNSSFILQFLAIGILMNSISLIPNNFFQGIGKPKIPTIVNLIELPFYIIIMWFAIKIKGINGAAFVYMIMASIDAIIMNTIAHRKFSLKINSKVNLFFYVLLFIGLAVPFFINILSLKLIYSIFYISVFVYLMWNIFLTNEEKSFLLSKVRLQN